VAYRAIDSVISKFVATTKALDPSERAPDKPSLTLAEVDAVLQSFSDVLDDFQEAIRMELGVVPLPSDTRESLPKTKA
jgi:hypothetical protein